MSASRRPGRRPTRTCSSVPWTLSRIPNLAGLWLPVDSTLTKDAEPSHGGMSIMTGGGSAWTWHANLTVTGGEPDPFGGTAACKVQNKDDAGSVTHQSWVIGSGGTTGQTYRWHFYFQDGNAGGWWPLRVDQGAARVYVNVSDGTVVADTGFAALTRYWTEDHVDPNGGHWLHVIIEAPRTTADSAYVYPCGVSANGLYADSNYQGVSTRWCRFYCGGIEQIGLPVSQQNATTGTAALTQGTAAQRPLAESTRGWPGGLSSIVWDGRNRSFAANDLASSASGTAHPWTLVWLAENTAVPSSDATLLKFWNSGTSSAMSVVLKSTNAINTVRVADDATTTTAAFTGKIPRVPAVMALVYDGTNVRLYVNGTEDASGAVAAGGGAATFDRCTVGGQYLACRQGGMLVAGSALSASDVLRVTNYLAAQRSIPAGAWDVIWMIGHSQMCGYEDYQTFGTGALALPRTWHSYSKNAQAAWRTRSWGPIQPYYSGLYIGPEAGVSEASYAASRNLAIVSYASVGADLYGSGANSWNPVGGDLYTNGKAHLAQERALLGVPTNLVGAICALGENDANGDVPADAFQANMETFISTIRADLSAPTLPFVLARIKATAPYPKVAKVWSGSNAISSTRFAVANADDLPVIYDGIHYTGGGEVTLGQRAYAALVAL